MKKPVFYGLWGFVTLLQAALLVGARVLAYVTWKRGGVNHHVAYRKRQYNTLIFTPDKVLVMQIALLVLLVVLLVLLVKQVRRKGGIGVVVGGESCIATLALLAGLSLPGIKAVRIYPYLMLILALVLVLALLIQGLWNMTQTR